MMDNLKKLDGQGRWSVLSFSWIPNASAFYSEELVPGLSELLYSINLASPSSF
jgi:hypothetical protein